MFNCLLKYPLKRGVSVNTRIKTGEIHKISPVLLSLGSNWEVIFARFQPQTGVFVRYLQFVVHFVNFLQDTRIKQLCEQKTTPRNRDETEISGYRDVLNTIHESYDGNISDTVIKLFMRSGINSTSCLVNFIKVLSSVI